MSDAEVGFYHRCLNHSWLNNGLPSDPTERSRVLGKTKAYCDKQWVRVGRCFIPHPSDPTRIINRRQEEQRQEARLKSESASHSANKRWADANAMRSDMRSHCEGNPRASESVSVSDSEVVNKEKKEDEVLIWFEQMFWPHYWRKTNRLSALKEWRKHAATSELRDVILKAMTEQSPGYLARDPEHRPHASTWLHQERYKEPAEDLTPVFHKNKNQEFWDSI